jgi:subtilisin family serine protease
MKRILIIALSFVCVFSGYSQQINWQSKDLATDAVFGISAEKACNELLKNKKPQKVIVAIIDSGIDTLHEDLRSVLWTDAKTGIHGWNYIGAETGKEDVAQLVGNQKDFYDSLSYTLVPEVYRAGYQQYRKIVPALNGKIAAMQDLIRELDELNTEDAKELKRKAEYHLAHGLNINNTEADTANGDADVSPDKIVTVKHLNLTPIHGTHVAGIIASAHYGIARNVQVMMLKTNGNIRELRDKSLAKAIRFAVDHGATIINCSFGKPYTWAKEDVDAAIAYARAKDVLILHAAGNSGDDNDVSPNYPDPDDKSNWMAVGASDEKGNAATFSNYGKKKVDVFAPGVNIYSTIPGNKYEYESGTSMATPVVAGLAALLRGYYPNLKAPQVKEIIMKSVVKRSVLQDKCISGGIVNAYNALKLARIYK